MLIILLPVEFRDTKVAIYQHTNCDAYRPFNFLVKSSVMSLTDSRAPCSTHLTLGMIQNAVHSQHRFLVTERPSDSSFVDVYKSMLECGKNG